VDSSGSRSVDSENITHFSDLLQVACTQPEPQRLLFVFVAAELPDNPNKDQVERYKTHRGGCLSPVMYVSMLPEKVVSFNSLKDESEHMGKHWDMLFVAALSGNAGHAPSLDVAEGRLQMMVESIQVGIVEDFLVFNRVGEVADPVAV